MYSIYTVLSPLDWHKNLSLKFSIRGMYPSNSLYNGQTKRAQKTLVTPFDERTFHGRQAGASFRVQSHQSLAAASAGESLFLLIAVLLALFKHPANHTSTNRKHCDTTAPFTCESMRASEAFWLQHFFCEKRCGLLFDTSPVFL